MTTYRGGAVSQDVPGESLSCRLCGGLAAHNTLAAHGAMCYPCYCAYCRKAFDPRPPRTDSATVAEMRTRIRGRFGSIA